MAIQIGTLFSLEYFIKSNKYSDTAIQLATKVRCYTGFEENFLCCEIARYSPSLINEFWNNLVDIPEEDSMRSTVRGRDIVINLDLIRSVFGFEAHDSATGNPLQSDDERSNLLKRIILDPSTPLKTNLFNTEVVKEYASLGRMFDRSFWGHSGGSGQLTGSKLDLLIVFDQLKPFDLSKYFLHLLRDAHERGTRPMGLQIQKLLNYVKIKGTGFVNLSQGKIMKAVSTTVTKEDVKAFKERLETEQTADPISGVELFVTTQVDEEDVDETLASFISKLKRKKSMVEESNDELSLANSMAETNKGKSVVGIDRRKTRSGKRTIFETVGAGTTLKRPRTRSDFAKVLGKSSVSDKEIHILDESDESLEDMSVSNTSSESETDHISTEQLDDPKDSQTVTQQTGSVMFGFNKFLNEENMKLKSQLAESNAKVDILNKHISNLCKAFTSFTQSGFIPSPTEVSKFLGEKDLELRNCLSSIPSNSLTKIPISHLGSHADSSCPIVADDANKGERYINKGESYKGERNISQGEEHINDLKQGEETTDLTEKESFCERMECIDRRLDALKKSLLSNRTAKAAAVTDAKVQEESPSMLKKRLMLKYEKLIKKKKLESDAIHEESDGEEIDPETEKFIDEFTYSDLSD